MCVRVWPGASCGPSVDSYIHTCSLLFVFVCCSYRPLGCKSSKARSPLNIPLGISLPCCLGWLCVHFGSCCLEQLFSNQFLIKFPLTQVLQGWFRYYSMELAITLKSSIKYKHLTRTHRFHRKLLSTAVSIWYKNDASKNINAHFHRHLFFVTKKIFVFQSLYEDKPEQIAEHDAEQVCIRCFNSPFVLSASC